MSISTKACAACVVVPSQGCVVAHSLCCRVCWKEGSCLQQSSFQRAALLHKELVNVTLKRTPLVLPWYTGKPLISPKIRGLAAASRGGMNCWAQLSHWLTEVTLCPPSLPAGPCRVSGSPCTIPAAWLEHWCWVWDQWWVSTTHVCSSVGGAHTRGRVVALTTRINVTNGNG